MKSRCYAHERFHVYLIGSIAVRSVRYASESEEYLSLPWKESNMFYSIRISMLTAGILLLAASVSLAEAPGFGYESTVPGYYLASGRGIAVDNDSNAYVFARTVGDQQQSNMLILKLNPAGDVEWSYYFDGEDHDYAMDILYNGDDQVYVVGWTDSESFPVTPDALDNTLTGFRDAFLMKLSTEDGSLIYSTFLGGDYVDMARGIALNSAGEIYLVGSTESTDFPTVNAYQDHNSSPLYVYSDIFITKLNPAGDSILYSTYFGGYKDDAPIGVEIDSDGGIVITGQTDATDFPLVNPIMSGPDNLFITRFSADGSTILFSTYFGGEDSDRIGAMTLDAGGNVYIAGSTRSVEFPTTPGAYQEEFAGEILGCEVPFGGHYNCEDMFVTKLAPNGSGIIYSSFLGGSTVEECRDLAIDGQGRAYLAGYTYSSDFPPDGIDFSAEIVLSRFSADGSQLDYSVTVNSGSANAGHGVAVDDAGNVYFTGAVEVPAEVYVARLDSDGSGNLAPGTPTAPDGATSGEPGEDYDFATSSTDPDGDYVYYLFDWGDGSPNEWIGPYNSGELMVISHSWDAGSYSIRVRARDGEGMESPWSPPSAIQIAPSTCGNVNGDTEIDISDIVYLVSYIFGGGPAPDPFADGDTDCSGAVDVDDAVYLVVYVFGSGPEPCAACQ
jgi:hypothetical protein